MKRSVSTLILACLAAACTPPADNGESEPAPLASETADQSATPTPSPDPTTISGGARNVSEETGDFFFEYSYPETAGDLPELRRLLDSRLDRARTGLAEDAAMAREEARDNGFPYNKHSTGVEWQVVADLPGWLSLSADLTSYTGGAHGMYGIDSLVWDKEEERAVDPIAMFESEAALGEAAHDRFCEDLNRQREERRGEPVPEDSDATFDQCPGIDELVLLVGSSNGRAFDRITLYAGPYVAGSYAEGDYEVNLPVTQAEIDALKPEYREVFAVSG